MSELLPCPLCGADGMVSIVDGYRPSSPKTYQPGCSADCGIYASVEFMSEESAIKWWNRRVPTARTPANISSVQPMPDWSQAPSDAQWWAMDINGGAYWYGEKPEMGEEGAWLATRNTVWDDTRCPNWKETLAQRPQPWDAAKEGGEEASVATVGEAAQKVASRLAIAMLEDNLKKGRSIHIPSLGITIEGESQPGDTQP